MEYTFDNKKHINRDFKKKYIAIVLQNYSLNSNISSKYA